MDDIESIIESTKAIMWDIVVYLPRVAIAVTLLFVGWIFAKFAKRIIIRILRFLRLEEGSERLGIDSFLLQGGVRYTLVTLVAEILYWFMLFSIMLFALNILGMTEAGEMLIRVTHYIPKVLIAIVVLIFGSLIARFIHAIMFAYLDNIGMQGAYTMSIIGQYAILAFVIFVSLEQLAIGGEYLSSAFQIAFGGFAIAFGIAFGLGGKDAAKSLLDKALKLETKERK